MLSKTYSKGSKTETKETTFNKNLGQALRTARVAAGLSQTEVAAYFSKSQDSISKIELGQTAVKAHEILEFSQYYKRPLTFFFMQSVGIKE
jgi:transcriptional regulator with XRE-family HTH domain